MRSELEMLEAFGPSEVESLTTAEKNVMHALQKRGLAKWDAELRVYSITAEGRLTLAIPGKIPGLTSDYPPTT